MAIPPIRGAATCASRVARRRGQSKDPCVVSEARSGRGRATYGRLSGGEQFWMEVKVAANPAPLGASHSSTLLTAPHYFLASLRLLVLLRKKGPNVTMCKGLNVLQYH